MRLKKSVAKELVLCGDIVGQYRTFLKHYSDEQWSELIHMLVRRECKRTINPPTRPFVTYYPYGRLQECD